MIFSACVVTLLEAGSPLPKIFSTGDNFLFNIS